MKDFIIVGSGIAGSVMAMTLLSRKKNIVVMDEPSLSSCSKVAAGLYNPIVFKRLTKSWHIDTLLPEAKRFYTEAETLLNKKIFHQKNIIKLFSEEQEKELWKKKSTQAEANYLSPEIKNKPIVGILHEGDYAEVRQAGYLDVKLFIDAAKELFSQESILHQEAFDYNLLEVDKDGIRYKNTEAKKIIFCEGHKAIENPFFPKNAFKPTKGEVLMVRIENFQEEKTLNKGVFVLPIGNDIYRVGATYEWSEINENATEQGKNELIQKLEKIINCPYEILKHEAGIRPTIIDRRPVVGAHPQHSSVLFLNGMGTKGVLHGPYCANALFQYAENELPINDEINISRFF